MKKSNPAVPAKNKKPLTNTTKVRSKKNNPKAGLNCIELNSSDWMSAFDSFSRISGTLYCMEEIKTGRLNWAGDFKKILGLNRSGLPEFSASFQTLLHPEDSKSYLKKKKQALKTDGHYAAGYRIKNNKNKYCYVNEYSALIPPTKGAGGQIVSQIRKVDTDIKLNADFSRGHGEFKSIVNELPLYIYKINLKGEVIFANNAYANLFNLTPGQLMGKTAFDLHPKNFAAKYSADDKKVIKNNKTIFLVEENINKITGKKEIFEVSKIPTHDEKGKANGLLGVFWSVPDLTAVEKTLRSVESKYREIFNATGEAIFIHDAETGEILDVNDAAGKMYGYTRDEFLNISLQELSSGENSFNLETARKKIFRSSEKNVETFEWRARKKKGELFWVEVSLRKSKIGGKGRVLAVVRDISRRKADEKTLYLSQVSINTSKDAVLWFNREGKILYVNESAFEMLKYSRKEIYSLTIYDVEYKTNSNVWESRLKSINENGSVKFDSFFVDRKSDKIPVEASMGYFKYENEEFIFSVVRDTTERNLAENKIRESEKKYRDMTELLPQGVFECDLTGRVTYANKKMFELLQRTPEDLANGFNVMESLVEEERERAAANIKAIYEKGEKFNYEYKMVRKDGTIFPVSTYSNVIRDENKPVGLRGIIVDVTERVALEEEKREHDNLFSLLFEKAGDANLLIEGDRFIDCNETAVKVLRAGSKEEIIKKHPWEISPEFQPDGMSSPDKAEMHIETAYNEGSCRFEWLHKRFDGTPFYVEVVLTAIPIKGKWYLHTAWRDINDKKNAEEKERIYYKRLEKLLEIERKILLAHSSENIAQSALKHIREILDCHRASVILFDKEKDHFTVIAVDSDRDTDIAVGSNFKLQDEDISGLKEGEVEIINNLADKINLTDIDRILFEEGIRSRISIPIIINNETAGSLNLSSFLPGNFNDEKIKIAQDVSVSISLALQHSNFIAQINRQNLELEKKVDDRTLQLKHTISELESFSYSVSHDLRAPLRSIGGFSQALIDDYEEKLDDDGKMLLKRIISASQKMSDLIDALLLLARITRSEMKMENVDLSSIFASVADEIQRFDSGRNAEFTIQTGLKVKGDQKLLKIAIENLISNAWKFTRNKSKAVIEFGSLKSNGDTVYFVKDNGVGFDMAYVNKLFGAFQRLHSMEEYEGTGIGLATTNRIILRHGGKIWAESKINEETIFYFTVPGK